MEIRKAKKHRRRWIIIAIVFTLCIVAGAVLAIASYRMNQVFTMSFEEMLAVTTRNNDQAIITVGILKNGEMTYTVYGKNASVLPDEQHVYEIGSITKTFTASLLSKAISEGKADLDAQISTYINLPETGYYPTLKKLVTHTSGYKETYFDWQIVINFLTGQKNIYYGINKDKLVNELANAGIKEPDYDFQYSNFGFATLGSVVESIYDTDYTRLMNDFIANELQLNHTQISDAKGDLSGYWNWKPGDAYIAAGAITSTITDMMQYIHMQMADEKPYLSQTHEMFAQVETNTAQYEKWNIRIDAVGIGWMIDKKNNIVWHNGGTTNFNSYAAFDKDKQIGVVILSNCSPSYRIPATVMGVKLMRDLQNEFSK